MMRIGLVTGEYPPMQGGVGAYSQILARTFAEQGHDVLVFSSAQAQEKHPEIALTHTTTQWGLPTLRAINRWAKTRQLDILNLQFQTAAYQMSPFIHFLPEFVRVPVVTTFHDLRFPYLFPKAGRLRDWIVMYLARTSDGVIVTNHEDWQRVQNLPHIALIPIGSNITTPLSGSFDRCRWREKAGAKHGDFLLTYFGFINHTKGVDILLQSLGQLREKNVPVKLVIIGGRTGSSDLTNAAYAEQIDRLIDRLGLASHIVWTGFVDEQAVSAYLSAGDAVVLPFLDGASYRRGTLMAAVHHGCAIITTTPQVYIPAFRDGENMLLIPPGSSAALAQAVEKLHQNPPLVLKLREGAAALDRHFDWSQIARDCVTFFERIIGEET